LFFTNYTVIHNGRMAERLKASVSKTEVGNTTAGSNPASSSKQWPRD
jgi:hypothetical protein